MKESQNFELAHLNMSLVGHDNTWRWMVH